MAGALKFSIGFNVNLKEFSTKMQTVQRKLDKVGKQMQDTGRTMSTYLTLPIIAAGAASIKMASDFQESMNKVDVVFGSASQSVKDFADTTLESFGLARGTALDMASTYGDMATSMGLPQDKAAALSTSLVGLAGDLASFKNISIEVANTGLNGIFTGETESLKQLGIVMTQHNLQLFASKNGINKKIEAMTEAEKVLLRYNYILEVTKNSQGDFARTGGGAANQTRKLQESAKQLGQEFGDVLLPTYVKVVTKLNEIAKGFAALDESSKKTIVVMAGVVAAIGPVLYVLGSLAKVWAIISSPIFITIAAIAALAAAIIWLGKNWDAITERFSNGWAKIKNNFIDGVINIVRIIQSVGNKFAEIFGIDTKINVVPFLEGLKSEVKENTKEFGSLGDAIKDALKIQNSIPKAKEAPADKMDLGLGEMSASSGGGESGYKIPKFDNIVLQQYDAVIAKQEELKSSSMEMVEQLPLVASSFETFGNRIQQVAQSMDQAIGDMFGGIISDGLERLGATLAGSETAFQDFGVTILEAVADFAGTFGKMLIAAAFASEVFQKALLAHPIAAAAAGVALIVAAGAVKNHIGNVRANMSAGGGGGSYGSNNTGGSNFANRNDNQMVLETVVYGNDLYLSNQRTNNRMFRVK